MKNIAYLFVVTAVVLASHAFAMDKEEAYRVMEESHLVDRTHSAKELKAAIKEAKSFYKKKGVEQDFSNGRCCVKMSLFDTCNTSSGKACYISPTSQSCTLGSDGC